MGTLFFFFSFQQFIYGIGWLIGSKLIPEIKEAAYWLTIFAFLCSFYFIISPSLDQNISALRIAINQGVAILAFMAIRKANGVLFTKKSNLIEEILLILLFSSIALFGFLELITPRYLLIGSTFVIIWITLRVMQMSYTPLKNEFGIAIALFVETPIALFLAAKTLQFIGLFSGSSIITSINNGAVMNLYYLGLLLVVTGMLHIGYVVILLKRLIINLEVLSRTDKLTNILNRRAAEDIMKREFCSSHRQQTPLCVLMIDIDFFKQINDQFGHAAGDITLQNIAQLIQNTIRISDYVARFGGEEFLVILPEIDEQQAGIMAERMCNSIEKNITKPNGERVTVSIGIAQSREDDENFEQVIARADQALYVSKQNGRNRVSLYSAVS